jgi:hypothetical protein
VTDMKDNDSATLARIDERTQAQTIAFALHVKDDGDKFDKVFSFITKRFDKADERFDKIETLVGELRDERNQRQGALGLSKILSGGIYACIALAAGYFGGVSHK